MEHKELYQLKGSHCSYVQCACEKGLLKLGGQAFSLHPSVAADLLKIFSAGQENKSPIELTPSLTRLPVTGMFQWAQAGDLPVQSCCSRTN